MKLEGIRPYLIKNTFQKDIVSNYEEVWELRMSLNITTIQWSKISTKYFHIKLKIKIKMT